MASETTRVAALGVLPAVEDLSAMAIKFAAVTAEPTVMVGVIEPLADCTLY